MKYRKLDLPSLGRFEGAGVFYSATQLEGQLCAGQEIAIVGGGNSAGQAAVYPLGLAKHVQVLVRGPGLADSMSRYLIQRIESTPNIDLGPAARSRRSKGESDWSRSPGISSTRGDRDQTTDRQPLPDDRRRSRTRDGSRAACCWTKSSS